MFKILVVGSGAVGKTSLVKKYSENSFSDNYLPTIGSNFASKKLSLDGNEVNYQIWDLGGQPQFKIVRQSFYRGAKGVVYVFDVSRRETFESLEKWREEVGEVCGEIPGIIIGNKIDLPRKVETEEGHQYSQCMNNPYFETSVFLNINIDESFESIGRLIIKRIQNSQNTREKYSIIPVQKNQPSSIERSSKFLW
ncbi:MAG: Rab family GTPase [Candidatus Jordarchaeum sp.]|uniref:Rab family GTPase n=1 Tax=Candidatus Jordarchaeum sp. TaxID=2823881 RepID=UPI004049D81B